MVLPGPTPRRRRPGPRRDEAARRAVLRAARELVAERGFRELTVDGIARRAGVGRQTVYRWWPSKASVLLESLVEDVDERLPVPREASTADDVRGYFRGLAVFLSKDPAGGVLLSLLAAARHDPEAAREFDLRFGHPRRVREIEMLGRAFTAGEIAPVMGLHDVLDALVGPLLYRAVTAPVVPRRLADELVAELLHPRPEPHPETG